jgi:hypothetical protein
MDRKIIQWRIKFLLEVLKLVLNQKELKTEEYLKRKNLFVTIFYWGKGCYKHHIVLEIHLDILQLKVKTVRNLEQVGFLKVYGCRDQ